MCGICGFTNFSGDWKKNIRKMCDTMISRGPDAYGEWASDDYSVILGHRRLSILDLSESGIQPMISATQRYSIVFNGEIYNHKEIAGKLLKERKVTCFRGNSDTEILLEAIEAYGFKNALLMTTGMFALAVYDFLEKKLFLARDRMGEKPLYYGHISNSFVFASDLKAIRIFDGFQPIINRDALALFFKRGYIPYTHSIYENIYKLEPGMILELEYPYITEKKYRYWNLKDIVIRGKKNIFKGTEEDAARILEEYLKKAISEQMIADVPVGAFLSGGIDSSTIVSLMQEYSKTPVKTFTVRNKGHQTDESIFAGKISDYIGTDNTIIDATPEDIMSVIPSLYKYYSEPFADFFMIPSFMVCALAKKNVSVILSGDAGDELFCGYGWYLKRDKAWKIAEKIPTKIRHAIHSIAAHTGMNHFEVLSRYVYFLDSASPIDYILKTGGAVKKFDQLVINSNMDSRQFDSELLENIEDILPDIRELYMYMDQLNWLPDDILTKVDRASMAVSLESRIPLLDKNIIEFSWSLPIEYKISGDMQKKVLKKILFNKVPKSFFDRPKEGFSIPLSKWLRHGKLRKWAEDILDFGKIRREGIIDSQIAEAYWNRFLVDGSYSRYVWSLIMFEQWYDHYFVDCIDKAPVCNN